MKSVKYFNGKPYIFRVGLNRKDDADAYLKLMKKRGYNARKTYEGRDKGWFIWVNK